MFLVKPLCFFICDLFFFCFVFCRGVFCFLFVCSSIYMWYIIWKRFIRAFGPVATFNERVPWYTGTVHSHKVLLSPLCLQANAFSWEYKNIRHHDALYVYLTHFHHRIFYISIWSENEFVIFIHASATSWLPERTRTSEDFYCIWLLGKTASTISCAAIIDLEQRIILLWVHWMFLIKLVSNRLRRNSGPRRECGTEWKNTFLFAM